MRLWQRTAVDLADMLSQGETTTVEIVDELTARTAEVGDAINGYTVHRLDEARIDAKELDEERHRNGPRSPLHGLPLTVKESIDVAGMPTTLGIRSWRHRMAENDAPIVAMAKAAGMVVLGKSNVPQALLSGAECENPLWGATRNPWSAVHGPGGSSGGEAALIASGQSVVGLGTDLGGSIRSPAAYCGIVGVKPTTDRWSNLGLSPALSGQELVRGQIGTLGRTVADCRLVFDVLTAMDHSVYDANVPPPPCPEAPLSLDGVRIGWYDDDGFVRASAACRRAVGRVADLLSDLGAELVAMPPPDQEELVQLYVAGVSSDGADGVRKLLAGELIAPPARDMWRAAAVPSRLRGPAGRLLRVLGEGRTGGIVAVACRRSVASYWELITRRDEMRNREMASWRSAGIAALVCPVTATPPIPVGESSDFTPAFGYTGRYNLMGVPAGTLPVTTVRPDETTSERRGDRLERRARSIERQSLGLPVGVQVVARPWRDQHLFDVMAAIEAGLGDEAPRTPR